MAEIKLNIDQSALLDWYNACPGQPEVDKNCTCPATSCALHGLCCACVAWHRDHGLKPLPHCLRNLEGVSWQERSELSPTSVLRSAQPDTASLSYERGGIS